MTEFSTLVDRTLLRIDGGEGDDRLRFVCDDGQEFQLIHHQDCCEGVSLESITGDLSDLLGTPITLAEEVSEEGPKMDDESYTWTFYKLATVKGHVTLRWYGSSNGYYSESVDFEKVED